MQHENSFEAYKSLIKSGKKKARAQLIFEMLYYHGPLSDVAILKRLFDGSDNRNLVSPRITELLSEGVLEEVGNSVENGKTVRLTQVKFPMEEKQQMEIF